MDLLMAMVSLPWKAFKPGVPENELGFSHSFDTIGILTSEQEFTVVFDEKSPPECVSKISICPR